VEVDADHAAGRADEVGGVEGVHGGAAAEVDYGLALAEAGEVEEVADPRERLDRTGRARRTSR
jgi:hypothetical protein